MIRLLAFTRMTLFIRIYYTVCSPWFWQGSREANTSTVVAGIVTLSPLLFLLAYACVCDCWQHQHRWPLVYV